MKRTLVCVLTLALAATLSVPAHAQETGAGNGFAKDWAGDLERVGKKLTALAEAVPADMYGWKPTKDVRSMSEVFVHVIGTNLLLPAALGADPPEGMEPVENPFAQMQEWEKTITEKEKVVAKLKKSLHYAAEAGTSIEDLDTEVTLFGPPASKRAYLIVLLTHAHEHLGQAIAYARSMGVVPPWSQPQEAPKADEDAGESEGDGGSY